MVAPLHPTPGGSPSTPTVGGPGAPSAGPSGAQARDGMDALQRKRSAEPAPARPQPPDSQPLAKRPRPEERPKDLTADLRGRLRRGDLHFRTVQEALHADATLGRRHRSVAVAAAQFLLDHVDTTNRTALQEAAQRAGATHVVARLAAAGWQRQAIPYRADLDHATPLDGGFVATSRDGAEVWLSDGDVWACIEDIALDAEVAALCPLARGCVAVLEDGRLDILHDHDSGWRHTRARCPPADDVCRFEDGFVTVHARSRDLRAWSRVGGAWQNRRLPDIVGSTRVHPVAGGVVTESGGGSNRVLRL
ncbi:MAG TPA: hypothetical protein VFH51_00295, partial [Myxococcota bacterium]|nr:hypothetical protein [Myxococcota bacterium]